jgi:hypothetical protein
MLETLPVPVQPKLTISQFLSQLSPEEARSTIYDVAMDLNKSIYLFGTSENIPRVILKEPRLRCEVLRVLILQQLFTDIRTNNPVITQGVRETIQLHLQHG